MLARCEVRQATATLSSTLRPRIRCTVWKVRLIPSPKRCCGGSLVTSAPSSSTRPRDGARLPPMMPSRVDLPAPFGPQRPNRARGGRPEGDVAQHVQPAVLLAETGAVEERLLRVRGGARGGRYERG